MTTSLTIEDFSLAEITRIRLLEAACRRIAEATDRMQAYRAEAENVSASMAMQAASNGEKTPRVISAKTMERTYAKWKNGLRGNDGTWLAEPRTWQTLVDRRTLVSHEGEARTSSPAFRNFLSELAAKHKRSFKTAFVDDLVRRWRNGENIPGYEGLNYKPNMPIPTGWSYDNLRRKLPDKREMTITRQGIRAAANMLPTALSTRAGSYPCSHVIFDDVWLDCLAWGPAPNGRVQLGRPLQIGALDYASGKRLCWGTRLRTMEESGKHLQLTHNEMLFVLCDFLHRVGYSPRGTVLLVEHGTAAITEAEEERLLTITNGLVRVERSGIVGASQPGSAYDGRALGNYRFKTWLESWHSLLHNRMDDQPLHTGHNRTEPETLFGLRRAQEALLRGINKGKIPAEIAAQISHYAPHMIELADTLAMVVNGINHRTDHALEGWEEMGYYTEEYCLDGTHWAKPESIPTAILPAVRAQALQTPSIARRRRLSPAEVWDHETTRPENTLIRLSAAECCAILGVEMAFPLTQKGGYFSLPAGKRHYANLLYESTVVTPWGQTKELPFGGKYQGVLNPLAETLFVLDEKGRCLGEAPRAHRFARTDEAAAQAAMGRVAQRSTAIAEGIDMRLAPKIAAEQAQIDYNAKILGSAENQALPTPPRRGGHRASLPPATEAENGNNLGLEEDYESSAFNY